MHHQRKTGQPRLDLLHHVEVQRLPALEFECAVTGADGTSERIAARLADELLGLIGIGQARVAAIPVAKPEAVLVNNPPPLPPVSTVAIAPKLLTNVGALMVYPLEALRNGWEGRTAFSLSITATGGVGK